jgi:microcystin-dependent protein
MSQPFLGQISMFGGNFAPQGWAMCNGQIVPIAQNDALFSLIGTTYGGDGVSTFALPNLQSRVAIDQGNGGGLSPRVMGEAAGTEAVTLTTQQIPQHNHGFVCSTTTAVAGGQAPAGTLVPGTPSPAGSRWFAYDDGSTPSPKPFKLENASLSMAGGNQAHENLMPTLCVTYIIALQGIFPSRN